CVHDVPPLEQQHAAVDRQRQEAHDEDHRYRDDRRGDAPFVPEVDAAAPHSHLNTALMVGVSVMTFQNGTEMVMSCSHWTVTGWPTVVGLQVTLAAGDPGPNE